MKVNCVRLNVTFLEYSDLSKEGELKKEIHTVISRKTHYYTLKASNTKYATVKNGVVPTKKAGAEKTVTITATSTDGTNKK